MASQNRTLGQFNLADIPPAPRGVPQIEVTFDIDANGIVHVSAKDLGTGKEQKIRIESSSGLSESEIDKMVKEAEASAEEDKAFREKVEVTNEADNFIYSTEKALKDAGDKVGKDEKEKIEAAISDLKGALEKGDVSEIKAKIETLKEASHKLAEILYQQQQANPGEAGDNTAADQEAAQEKKDDPAQDAEDADYEVVDDEK